MFHNFNLPHGNSKMDEDGDGIRQQSIGLENDTMGDDHEGQQRDDFEQGISDEEGHEAAFDLSYPGLKQKKSLQSNSSKKSPRRTENDDSDMSSPETKRPRPPSLFGDGATHSDEDAHDEKMPPKTPGQGIGMRLSSLNLEQQDESIMAVQDQHEDDGEVSSVPRVNVGAGLDLLVREDSSELSEHSTQLDEDEFLVRPENPALAYGLRTNIDRTVAGPTWMDVDQSGNYDPNVEAKEKMLKLQKAKAKKSKKGKQRAAPKKRDLSEVKMKFIVKLRIRATGNVLNITNNEDHWSDGHSIIDTDEEREMQERRAIFRLRTPGVEPQEPIPDPRSEVNDLTGHPAARGCKECRKHNQDCSAVSTGEFPCAQCDEDGIECQPILATRIQSQGPCNACEQLNVPCSFEDGGGSSICDRCLDDDNFDCAPSATVSYTANRIDLNRLLYGPDRKHVMCTYCRTHKKRCSLKEKEDKPPCKYCKRHGIGCTFYDAIPLDVMKKSSKAKGKQKATRTPTSAGPSRKRGNDESGEVSVPDSEYFDPDDLIDLGFSDSHPRTREPTPECEMEDAEGHSGILTNMNTSFAHPIQFQTTEDDAIACNFCEMPVFGFVGHFEKKVHVIKWYDGRGCTEIAAGHREEHDATIMCSNCTFARLQVLACPGHAMQRVDDSDTAQDFDAAAEELMEAEPRSEMMQWQLQRWCSMCFSLATFRCCTPQPSITGQGTEEEEDQLEGCGLRLCDRCEGELSNTWQGVFADIVVAFDGEKKPSEDDVASDGQASVRADVGFLRLDGFLMKSVEGAEEMA